MNRYTRCLLAFLAVTLAIFCVFFSFYLIHTPSAIRDASVSLKLPGSVLMASPSPGLLSIGTLGFSGDYAPPEGTEPEEPGETEIPADETEMAVLLQIRDTLGSMLALATVLIACGVVWIILYPLWMFSR